jgi:hypothetical protein
MNDQGDQYWKSEAESDEAKPPTREQASEPGSGATAMPGAAAAPPSTARTTGIPGAASTPATPTTPDGQVTPAGPNTSGEPVEPPTSGGPSAPSAPAPKNTLRRWAAWRPNRRPSFRRWLLPAVAGLCVVVAGLVWALWPSSSAAPTHVVSGTVQATVLSADDVSRLAGATVVSAASTSQPPPALSADQPGCVVAVGPATRAVYGQAWTGFLSVTYQDSAHKGSMTVNQVAAIFPSADKAAATFGTLSDGLKGCPAATVVDRAGRAMQWHYAVGTQDSASLAWTATQDAGNGWACHHQARLTGRSLLQVSVCEAGDGESVATAVADRFAAQAKG